MRVLVTGGAGFVGQHLVEAVLRRCPAAIVTATDLAAAAQARATASWGRRGRRVAYHSLDVTDRAAVAELAASVRPTHVIHAAAMTPGPWPSRDESDRTVAVNVFGTATLAEATLGRDLRRFVLVSSAAVFSPDRPGLLAEDDEPDDQGLYATTKRGAERIATSLGGLRRGSVAIVRLASVYGPGERPGPTRPRASLVHRLADAPGRLRVAGPDVARDWVHAEDAADAVVALADAPALARSVYHLGGGEAVGLRRLVAAFAAAGRDVRLAEAGAADLAVTEADRRPTLSIAAAGAELGYRPRSIERGIADLVAAAGAAPGSDRAA